MTMVGVIGKSENEWERWAMRHDHTSWGAAGNAEKYSERRDQRGIVNNNYQSYNYGPLDVRATIVWKGGKATFGSALV